MNTIETRVRRLEVSNGRWRLATLSLLALVGCGTYMAADAPSYSQEITTGKLRIEDADGNVRAVLGVIGDDAVLILFATGNKARTMVTGGPSGSELSFLDDELHNTIQLVNEIEKGSALQIFDTEERIVCRVFHNEKDRIAGYSLMDTKGNPRAIMVAVKDEFGIEFADKNNKPIWSAP